MNRSPTFDLLTGRAGFLHHKVRQLHAAGLSPRDMAVIAPYAAQVRWLREHWDYDDLEIDTVDGFQGREKEAVLITCVRSNSTGEIGFLADTRRMNVALTRARRKLIVVGDSATLGGHKFYAAMLLQLNVGPAEAVFVDDRAVNVEAAKSLGMRGILYTAKLEIHAEVERLAQEGGTI